MLPTHECVISLSLSLSLSVCVCVCVRVCALIRKRETEGKESRGGRDGGSWHKCSGVPADHEDALSLFSSACIMREYDRCVYIYREREREREREGERQRERETDKASGMSDF